MNKRAKRPAAKVAPQPTPLIPRRLRHMDSNAQWAERSPENRLICTASDAAFRLRGFASVLRSIQLTFAAHEITRHAFLASTIDDIALALEEARQAAWDAAEAEEAQP